RASRHQYSATPANFFNAEASNEIIVEFTSCTVGEKDSGVKQSSSSSHAVENETMTNMLLVCHKPPYMKHEAYFVSAKKSTKPCVATSISAAQGEVCEES